MIRRRLSSWPPIARGVGDVGVQRDAVEVGLDVAGPVETGEEVAGGDVRRHLQRPAEEAADDHLRSGVDRVQDPPGDPDQLREAGRIGRVAKVTMFSSFQISQRGIGR